MATKKAATKKKKVTVKVGMVGDAAIGKTSLMVRFVEGTFDETQLPTQGVNFMERGVIDFVDEFGNGSWARFGQIPVASFVIGYAGGSLELPTYPSGCAVTCRGRASDVSPGRSTFKGRSSHSLFHGRGHERRPRRG